MILSFNEFSILEEKTLGSENIRSKYYSDIDKHIFYKIVNIDPTSVRKKEFSKPGKYVKWLLMQYKTKNLTDELLNDKDYIERLNYYLFIFSTQWFKNKVKKEQYYLSGELLGPSGDIFKYGKTYGLSHFVRLMKEYRGEYEKETEQSKFEFLYEDDKVTILIPLNFSASYEISKNTDWCTKHLNGFSMWSQVAILYRIIPKDKNCEMLKLTWNRKGESRWYIAGTKYPEILGYGNPFTEYKKEIDKKFNEYGKYPSFFNPEHWNKITKTMNLLNNKSIQIIIDHYNKNTNNNLVL